MIPVPQNVLTYLDFSLEDVIYKDLLENEYRFCKDHLAELYKKAEEVYKIGCNRNHPLAYTCCDFKKLEKAMQGYDGYLKVLARIHAGAEASQTAEEVASIIDTHTIKADK